MYKLKKYFKYLLAKSDTAKGIQSTKFEALFKGEWMQLLLDACQ